MSERSRSASAAAKLLKRSIRMERHKLDRQRNLLKKQELDVKWAEHDAASFDRVTRLDPKLALNTPNVPAKDYVELLKAEAGRTNDARKRKELCLRAAIVKTQCAPNEMVDTKENERIYKSILNWADTPRGMSVAECVAANEKVVAEELERLEVIVPEEMQLRPKAPEKAKENAEPKAQKNTAPQRML